MHITTLAPYRMCLTDPEFRGVDECGMHRGEGRLCLSVVGPDRVGIVSVVSDFIKEHATIRSGNACRLDDYHAAAYVVLGPLSELEVIRESAGTMLEELNGSYEEQPEGLGDSDPTETYRLRVIAPEGRGRLAMVSQMLAKHRVNIVGFAAATCLYGEEEFFSMKMKLQVPKGSAKPVANWLNRIHEAEHWDIRFKQPWK